MTGSKTARGVSAPSIIRCAFGAAPRKCYHPALLVLALAAERQPVGQTGNDGFIVEEAALRAAERSAATAHGTSRSTRATPLVVKDSEAFPSEGVDLQCKTTPSRSSASKGE